MASVAGSEIRLEVWFYIKPNVPRAGSYLSYNAQATTYNWSSYCSTATRTSWPRVRTPVFWNRLCKMAFT
jgi:hypothetical protein